MLKISANSEQLLAFVVKGLSNSDGEMTWGKDLWGSLKGLANST